jgi:superfamily I DNA and/or RNA helicase
MENNNIEQYLQKSKEKTKIEIIQNSFLSPLKEKFDSFIIENTYGAGKTEDIIKNFDKEKNSLVVTFTISSANDLKRRSSTIDVIHYHQLIYDTAKNKLGYNLKDFNDNFSQNIYENIEVFSQVKNSIKQYSQIFVDIDSPKDLKATWIQILKRYFLKSDGEIFFTKLSKNGKSKRLTSSITKIINSFNGWYIQANEKNGKSNFVITNNNITKTIQHFLEKEKSHQVTILGWDLATLRNIEKDISNIHSSFPPFNVFERDVMDNPDGYLRRTKGYPVIFQDIKYRVAEHFLNKEYRENFNPSENNLNISTIESFRGLESDVVFLILTPNMPQELILSAISRTKNKLYIFDFGYQEEHLFQLKWNVDEILGLEPFNKKIYITLFKSAKKNILYEFFSKEHKEFTEQYSDMIERYNDKFNNFFAKLFHPYEKLTFINIDESIALVNQNTVLHIEQRESNNVKDKYFVCTKIETKKNLFLQENNSLEIDSQLILEENNRVREQANYNSSYNEAKLSDLLEKVSKKNPVISVTETEEYKKWKIYLDLQKKVIEKEKYFYLDYFDFKINDNKVVSFPKPYDGKLKYGDTIFLLNNNMKFGKIKDIQKNIIKFDQDENFEINEIKNNYEIKVFIDKKSDEKQNKNLQNALDNIITHPFRFYLFGNQKLNRLENIKSEKDINWFNKDLNPKQKEAVLKALATNEIFLIQGPPGTGKTSVISEIAYQEICSNKTVLITSESNDAIENAIERINSVKVYPYIYQSYSRKENSENNEESFLPIEGNLGRFYKNKISSNLEQIILSAKESVKKLEVQEIKLKEELLVKEKALKEHFKKIEIALKASLEIADDKEEKIELNIKHEEKKDKAIKGFNDEQNTIKNGFLEEKNRLKEKSLFIEIQEEFKNELEKADEETLTELEIFYPKNVNLYGATLSLVGKSHYKKGGVFSWNLKGVSDNNINLFDVVIVDEVSKATPVLLNFALLRGKKIILVGDHKQLPPMLSQDISLEEFANEISKTQEDKKYKEILEELHNHKTVFERLFENNPNNSVQLTTQYRMHKDVQKAVENFYEGGLECGTSKLENKHKLFNSKNLVWTSYNISETENKKSTSYFNEHEIKLVELTLEKLNDEYKNIDFKPHQKKPNIGVISFYGEQVKLLSKIQKDKFQNLEIDFGTVDTFQGQERDFIIVSMVRSNPDGQIGFARSFNRINVAFSRAKQLLIIVGNASTFTQLKKNDEDEIKKAKEVYKKIFQKAEKGILNDSKTK